MRELAGETIHVDRGYPVDITEDLGELLRMAQHNEYEEHDVVYQQFGDKAKEEGFSGVANSFYKIAVDRKISWEIGLENLLSGWREKQAGRCRCEAKLDLSELRIYL